VDTDRARKALVSSLSSEIRDQRVLTAFSKVPRELFVPSELWAFAYDDRPLSIGYGQTISQPYVAALMTEALELRGGEKVLEIGTGSGYQTAILAELGASVYSTERISELGEAAISLLKKLGCDSVTIRIAHEELGWKAESPFEAIIVTAGAPSISPHLLDQLDLGGRLVIPVGSKWEQELLKITKGESGNRVQNLGSVRFVPLIGDGAWEG
jgi:protein-L-isoaspartate(D-aspartate) O-methyltransferase